MHRLALATMCSFLCLTAAAEAAIVDIQDSSRKVRFIADPGEANRVTVTQSGTALTFTDAGAPVTAAPLQTACVADGPSQVTCTLPAADYRAQVEAEDLDDEVVNHAQVRVNLDGDEGADRLTGGAGADHIAGGGGNDIIEPGAGTDLVDAGDGDDVVNARDALRDTIACGLGTDSGQADLEDELTDCESVVKPLVPPTVGDGDGGTTATDPGAPTGDRGLHLGELPKPTPGQRVAVGITSGTARVKLAGSSTFVELDPTKPVPVGATIDARSGVINLVAASDLAGATQSAKFTGGVFTVAQKRERRMTTVLTLTGGDFSQCRTGSRTTARAAAARKVRKLWGSGHGRFTTRGRNSTATVRGTIWSVTDRCDGTLTRVERGAVAVRDLKTKRTRVVRAGQQYLARR